MRAKEAGTTFVKTKTESRDKGKPNSGDRIDLNCDDSEWLSNARITDYLEGISPIMYAVS